MKGGKLLSSFFSSSPFSSPVWKPSLCTLSGLPVPSRWRNRQQNFNSAFFVWKRQCSTNDSPLSTKFVWWDPQQIDANTVQTAVESIQTAETKEEKEKNTLLGLRCFLLYNHWFIPKNFDSKSEHLWMFSEKPKEYPSLELEETTGLAIGDKLLQNRECKMIAINPNKEEKSLTFERDAVQIMNSVALSISHIILIQQIEKYSGDLQKLEEMGLHLSTLLTNYRIFSIFVDKEKQNTFVDDNNNVIVHTDPYYLSRAQKRLGDQSSEVFVGFFPLKDLTQLIVSTEGNINGAIFDRNSPWETTLSFDIFKKIAKHPLMKE